MGALPKMTIEGTDEIQHRPQHTGKTTELIKNAPSGAVFVWCNEHSRYAQKLAKELARADLRIVTLDWIVRRQYAGLGKLAVIFDHAFDSPSTHRLDHYEMEAVLVFRAYVEQHGGTFTPGMLR